MGSPRGRAARPRRVAGGHERWPGFGDRLVRGLSADERRQDAGALSVAADSSTKIEEERERAKEEKARGREGVREGGERGRANASSRAREASTEPWRVG